MANSIFYLLEDNEDYNYVDDDDDHDDLYIDLYIVLY